MTEKMPDDAVTGVTLRLPGRGDGSGHHKIKLLGSRGQADLEALGRALLEVENLIACKISLRRKWIEALYNQAGPVETVDLLDQVASLGYEWYE